MKGQRPHQIVVDEQVKRIAHAYQVPESMVGRPGRDAFGIPLIVRSEIDKRNAVLDSIMPDFVRWLNEQGTRYVKEIPESLDLSARDGSDRETDEPKHPATLRSVSHPDPDQRQTPSSTGHIHDRVCLEEELFCPDNANGLTPRQPHFGFSSPSLETWVRSKHP